MKSSFGLVYRLIKWISFTLFVLTSGTRYTIRGLSQWIKSAIVFISVFAMMTGFTIAQPDHSVTGKLIDGRTNMAVPFATVTLVNQADSKVSGGAFSDENGVFDIHPVAPGIYSLRVSTIGYKPAGKSIEVTENALADAGIIVLSDTSIVLQELVIVGERSKAGSEGGRTVYNMTEKIIGVTNNAIDVLKLIPGIRVDLMQNISLEGSTEIRVFVDGRERDRSYISQLDPGKIDRVEVISVPPSGYDGSLTGAINIILKKDRKAGINGQFTAEIPTSFSEVYIFPVYSLDYGYKKFNLYTSYNGEFTYFDQQETSRRWIANTTGKKEIAVNQLVRQKNWSHRFHYGFDYFLAQRDQLSFYAFYNPYSYELDGTIETTISGRTNSTLMTRKDDTDRNTGNYYSLFYKHSFDKKGRELTSEINTYRLRAENGTDFVHKGQGNEEVVQKSRVMPEQHIWTFKVDYTTPFLNRLTLTTGVKARIQVLNDRLNYFKYRENISAAYSSLELKLENIEMSAGLRAENSTVSLKDAGIDPVLIILPSASIRYKLNTKQNLLLAFNRTIRRPNLYQLNPSAMVNDPLSISAGNPFLKPQMTNSAFLEHSIRFSGNYLATRLFFNRATDAINYMTIINNEEMFETQVHNLGTVSQLGLQVSGSLKAGILTLNPYIRISGLRTSGNNLAMNYMIGDSTRAVLGSGLSAIATFKNDLAFSFSLNYSTPNYDIQGSSFSDLIYFLQLDKTFKNRIKVSITSALPLTRSFLYRGSEVYGEGFYNRYEGIVKLSSVPLWFKVSYRFSSGRKMEKAGRSGEEIETLPKKGF